MKTRRFFSLFFLLVLMASLVLTPASAADEESGVTPPELHCEAMLLVDANTGRMVYGKNEHEQMYPASHTKIMTALLVLEAVDNGQLSLDQPITATESRHPGRGDPDGGAAAAVHADRLRQRGVQYPGGAGQRQRGCLRGCHECQGRSSGV